jgi:hypothetical protein
VVGVNEPPQFAEFYSTIATLAPILLLAQLIGLRDTLRRRKNLPIALGVVGGAASFSILVPLTVLAGGLPDDLWLRVLLILMLIAQLAVGTGGFLTQAYGHSIGED